MIDHRHCKHCGMVATRPRCLCRDCYYDPNIRRLYSTASKYAQAVKRRLPVFPTRCKPGTILKIKIMRQRYEAGLMIHHPLDARYERSKQV